MRVFAKLALLVFLYAVSTASYAFATHAEDCRALITKNYIKETVHYRLNPDNYNEPTYGNDHVARSIYFVRQLLNDLGCSRKSVNFSKGPNGRGQSRCREMFRGKPHTRSCYIHTNLGYFHVTTDLTDGVNLLYSRWD